MKEFFIGISVLLMTMSIVSAQSTHSDSNAALMVYSTVASSLSRSPYMYQGMESSKKGMCLNTVTSPLLSICLNEVEQYSKVLLVGRARALTSVPFLLCGTNCKWANQKREAGLAIKGERVKVGNSIIGKSNYAAVALTIQL